MPVKTTCPACSRQLLIKDEFVGKTVRCPECKAPFPVTTVGFIGKDTVAPSVEAKETQARAAPAPTAALGRIGRFQVTALLGQGAFGTVYRAQDPVLDREVALKVPRFAAHETERMDRFLREAKAAAKLRHPNIVAVFEAGTADKQSYIASEFVEGQTLAARVSAKRVPFVRAAEWVRDLALGMAYAHDEGIVHRDVKPQNVMLGTQDRPQLTDFGLAKRVEDDGQLTTEGSLLGTPAYMAPEQARGDVAAVGPRSDQYALGVVLYELLTGRTPFEGNAQSLLYDVVNTPPPPPRTIRRNLPRDLEAVCLKALAKDPDERYADCGALAADLNRWLDGDLVRARKAGPVRRLVHWSKRHPAVAGWVAAVVLLLLLVSGFTISVGIHNQALADERQRDADKLMRDADQQMASAVTLSQQSAEKERLADEARKKAETEARDVEGLRLRAETLHYARLIDGARRGWRDNLITPADAKLEDCRWDYRHWEHAYLRRLVTGGERTLLGHVGAVTCVAYSPDGTRIASGGADRTVRLWDTVSGQILVKLTGHQGPVTALAFSPDGRRLVTTQIVPIVPIAPAPVAPAAPGDRIKEMPKKLAALLTLPLIALQGPAPAPGGAPEAPPRIAQEVKVWDVRTGKPLYTYTGHTEPVFAVAFSPDGKRIASGSLEVLPVAPANPNGPPTVAPANPNGPPMFQQPQGAVHVWDAVGGGNVTRFHVGNGPVHGVVFSPDGKRLAAAAEGWQNTVKVWDTTTKEAIFTPDGQFEHVAFSPDGERLAAVGKAGTIQIWEVATGSELATLKDQPAPLAAVAYSADGSTLAVAGGDPSVKDASGFLKLYTSSYGLQDKFVLRGHAGAVSGVAFRPDGRQLVTASADGTVKLWDAVADPESRKLRANAGMMNAVAFSPDGQFVAGAAGTASGPFGGMVAPVPKMSFGDSDDVEPIQAPPGSAIVWEARTGVSLFTLQGHSGGILSVVFSPDGEQLATGGKDQRVRLWDRRGARELRALPFPVAEVRAVAFSPDGALLAAAGGNPVHAATKPNDNVRIEPKAGAIGEVRLWDVKTGQERHIFTGHADFVSGLAFRPDGKRLVTSSKDRTVRVWDVETGRETAALTGYRGEVVALAYSPDGLRIAGAAGDSCFPDRPGEVPVWDAATGELLFVLRGHAAAVTGVAFSPDSRRIVSGGGSDSFPDCYGGYAGGYGHGAYGGCVPDAPPRHASISEVKVWDSRTGIEVLHLNSTGVGNTVSKTVCVTSVKEVKVTRGGKTTIEMQPYTTTRTVTETVKSMVKVTGVAFSPDGERIAASDQGGDVTVWDAHLCQPHVIDYWKAGVSRCVAASPDGKLLAAAGDSGSQCDPCDPGAIKVYDAVTGREVFTLRGRLGHVHSLAFSPDSRRLASAAGCIDAQGKPLPGDVEVWDARTGALLQSLKKHVGLVHAVAYSPDGKYLASAGTDRLIQLWDAKSGEEVRAIKGLSADVYGLAFSPNGQWLAAAGGDRLNRDRPGDLRLFAVANGQEPRDLRGHTGPVWSVAVHPDGKRLASAGADGTLRLWDADEGKLLRTLDGGQGDVNSVTFSTDGKLVAGAGGNWSLIVWDADSGDRKLTLHAHRGPVGGAVFLPDQRRLATAGTDPAVRVWDVTAAMAALPHCTPTPPRLATLVLRGHTKEADLYGMGGRNLSVAYSGDGKRLATGNEAIDRSAVQHPVRLFDATLGETKISLLIGHQGLVRSVDVHPDGNQAASASEDNTVRVWDLTRREELHSLPHDNQVMKVIYSPDGKLLASGTAFTGAATLWDPAAGKERRRMQGDGHTVFALAFSPDSQRLATGGRDGVVKVWNVADGKELLALKGHAASIQSLAFSADGKLLASGSADKTIKLWNAADGKEVRELTGHKLGVRALVFHPDNQRLASGGSYPLADPGQPKSLPVAVPLTGEVKLWSVADGKELLDLKGQPRGASGLAFSPDGKRLACCGRNEPLKVWDLEGNKEVFANNEAGECLAYGKDGQRIVAASVFSVASPPPKTIGVAKLWDPATGKELRTIKGHDDALTGVALSADGKRLVTSSLDGTAALWDADTGNRLAEFRGHTGPVWSAALSPDGRTLVTAAPLKWYGPRRIEGRPGSSLRVWDAATGKELAGLEGHQGNVNFVAFRPDGKQFASAGDDRTIRLWDADQGKEVLVLPRQPGSIATVVYSPDGGRLASVVLVHDERMQRNRGLLRIWDTATGKRLLSLKVAGRDSIWQSRGLAFSPDGRRIATVGESGDALVLDAESGARLLTLNEPGREPWARSGVTGLAFSPDGKRVATGGMDRIVRVWDAQPEPQSAYPDPMNLGPQSQPDKEAAAWVLKAGGSLGLRVDGVREDLGPTNVLIEDPFTVVAIALGGDAITDVDADNLKGLTDLEVLRLDCRKLTDVGLARIGELTGLRELYLNGTQLTDDGLARLKGLTNLQVLHLNDTKITDAALEHLKGLERLRNLESQRTALTDAGLEHLKVLRRLRGLGIVGTNATEGGINGLRQALPRLQINGIPPLAPVGGIPPPAPVGGIPPPAPVGPFKK